MSLIEENKCKMKIFLLPFLFIGITLITIRFLITVRTFPSSWSAQRVISGMTPTHRESSKSRTNHPLPTSRVLPSPARSRLYATWSALPSTRMASRTCLQRLWGLFSTRSPQLARDTASYSRDHCKILKLRDWKMFLCPARTFILKEMQNEVWLRTVSPFLIIIIQIN